MRQGALACLSLAAPPMLNFGRTRLEAAERAVVSTRAVDLVLESLVIDMLGLLTLDWAKLFRWQRRARAFGDDDFRGLARSGVKVFHPAVDTGLSNPVGVADAWLDGWSLLLGSSVCRLARVETAADLRRIPQTGRIGVIVGFQNSSHFRAASDVARYFRAGQRVSQLTYNENNRLGTGCHARLDRGLSGFGATIVTAMNEAGIAIDVSHCSERTSLDAISASSRPVLVTHGNCRALNPQNPRCKSDEVMRRLAAKGGVIGMTVVRSFVGGEASLARLLDHFEHAIRVAGVDHVGLGSDVDVDAIDPRSGRPHPFYAIPGLDAASRVFQIADGLLARGFARRDVELVLGGNFVRALADIWPSSPPDGAAVPSWRRDPFCPEIAPALPSRLESR